MKLSRLMASALALALVAGGAQAQYGNPAPPPLAGAVAVLYAPPQLDQMLAAIALYPDPLLTDILTAATYPYEVDQAARWLQEPQVAALTDGALAATLQNVGWDPSVKSLVPFPQVLRMMDAHLDWTQAIGNAFLAQQADVMDSIQRLRHEALADGALVSSPYQTVTVNGPYIAIEPASPQLVYVPVYDPTVVYRAWPYPAYRPLYFGPPPGLSARFVAGGIGFGIGIGVVDVLWHWADWDWRGHDVHVDADRFNRINAGRPPINQATWQHDPEHRRGVPYRDPKSRAAYERPMPGSADDRRQFRFGAPQQANLPTARPQEQRTPQPAPQSAAHEPPRVQAPRQERPAQRPEQPLATAPAPQPQAAHEPPRAQAPGQERPAQRPEQPHATAPAPQMQTAPAPQPQTAPAPQPARQAPAALPVVTRPAPPPATAFQGIAGGHEAQAAVERGHESRQAATPPAPAPHAVAPQAQRNPPQQAQHQKPQSQPPKQQQQQQQGNPRQQERQP